MQISSALAFLPPPSIHRYSSISFQQFLHHILLSCCQDRWPIRPVFVPCMCEFHCKLQRTVAQAGDRRSLALPCTLSERRGKSVRIYLSVKVSVGSEIGHLGDSRKNVETSAASVRGNLTF